MDVTTIRTLATAAGTFATLATLALLPYLFGWLEIPQSNRAGMTVILVFLMVLAGLQFTLRAASPRLMESLHPNIQGGIFFSASLVVGASVVFAGPRLGSMAAFAVEIPLLAFFALRTRWAIGVTAFSIATYGVGLLLLDDHPAPLQEFINVVASAGAAGVLIGGLASSLDKARHSLADLNHNLEDRVAEQLEQLERAGRLRRFLSPQVADVVMSTGTTELLAPHRRAVAVLFVDLRGFTHFTNSVDADHVMRVLDEYYRVVGSILDSHGATIGGFDGDGVMAYIGDPVPVPAPAREAVTVAQEVARALDQLVEGWSVAEASLGYGIGIAYGVATLGVVGFEGRADYTPVGAVVNLAARLCSDARSGEIVIDEEARREAKIEDAARRPDVDLKGFGAVATYTVSV